jgi:protocatechuate 3,4-dioxygenase beta subunit
MNVRGAFAAAVVLAAASWGPAAAAPTIKTLVLVDNDEPGTRLTLTGTVIDRSGRPVPDAELHVYQTDASGRYTHDRAMDEPHARLAGWVLTDDLGRFEIHTIRPGGYQKTVKLGDRERKIPAHIHIDVSAQGFRSRKLQAVSADDPLLLDPYWKDWVAQLDQPVLAVTSDGGTAVAEFQIVLEAGS